jgi:hypothetical protein
MFGVVAVLDPMHIQIAGLEIDLLPSQRHEFRGAEAMAKHQQNDGGIAHPMPPGLPSGLHHSVDFVWAQILAHRGIAWLFPGRPLGCAGGRLCRKRTLEVWS